MWINDQLSHGVGDQVLQAVADLLQEAAGHPKVAARLGGEEFVVVLPRDGLSGTIAFGERPRRRIVALD